MFRLRPGWVLPLTLLSILPLLVIGALVVQRLTSLNEERYLQEVVAARYATEVAADGIRDRLRDHFRPWRQTLTYTHVQGEEVFESRLRKMYLTSPLVESPQFVEEAILRRVAVTPELLLPAGMSVAELGHRCDLVSIAALRQDLFDDGRRRMGFDPQSGRFKKSRLIVDDADMADAAPIHWLSVDLDGPLVASCKGCERELLELGTPGGSRTVALLAVIFPLPGGADMTPGMFGAIIPAQAFLKEVVIPEVQRFHEGQDALPRHGLRVIDTGGAVLLPLDPESSASGRALRDGDALYSEFLFGDESPWQLQVVAFSGFNSALVRAENHRWTFVMVAAALLLAFGAIFFGRSFLHHLETARLRTHLLSNVSHELKTPLSLIRLYAETLESGRARNDEDRQKFVGIIGRESKRLSHLIDNLLDVQRIEENRKLYSFAQVRPDRVVRQTVEAYRYQLTGQGFELRLDVDDNLPLLHLDEEAIAQALINLLDNAAKYSDTIKDIRVHCGQRHDNVCISVEDRGIGIPPREQDKIFQSFYRVDQSMVHDVKGSGLGLAVVAHVASAHAGSVMVESKPGRGSTFTLCLPIDFEPEHS